jgi:hypothetical protein
VALCDVSSYRELVDCDVGTFMPKLGTQVCLVPPNELLTQCS